MFEAIKSLLNRGERKMDKDTTMPEYLKDIWALKGVPAFYQYWLYGIWPWKYVYRGYYKLWHYIYAPTVAEKNNYRDMYRLNAAKFLCMQMARYIWSEQCDVTVNVKGAEDIENDILNRYVHYVLEQNNFNTKLGDLIEYSMAEGGGAIKTWCEVNKDDEGNAIPADGSERLTSQIKDSAGNIVGRAGCRIPLSYHTADQFVPTRWNNHEVTDGIFISREAKGGWYYSRLEWHKWNEGTYVVENSVYRMPVDKTEMVNASPITGGYGEPQNILGWWYPLNQVYPLLSPMAKIEHLDHSLFVYFKSFGANNMDDNSPLGMSIFANAMDTLRSIDIAFDGFVNEIRMGRRRIIVPARALSEVTLADSSPRRYFDPNDSVYEALNFDNVEDLKIQDSSVDIRVEPYVNAINANLATLCVQTGLDAGVLSFDKGTGLRTATEVISENSKTYQTIQCHKNNLKDALKQLMDNILQIARLYNVEFEGQALAPIIDRGYECNVHFDDSIIEDKQSEITQGLSLMAAGVMSKKTFLTGTLGMTPDAADEELQRIADEQRITPNAFDVIQSTSED